MWHAVLPLIGKCDVFKIAHWKVTNWMEKEASKLVVVNWSRDSLTFIVPKGSLPYSEPDECTLHSHQLHHQISVCSIPASTPRFPYRYISWRISGQNFASISYLFDRLCGPMVRVSCYRSRGPGLDSGRYQIFWEVVGLERGPLSLVITRTIEELLGRNSSGSGLEIREYGRGNLLPWPRDTLYPQKLAITSPTSGGRSVGIVRLRSKATESVCLFYPIYSMHSRCPTQLMLLDLITRILYGKQYDVWSFS
jgi:hypothetical protein